VIKPGELYEIEDQDERLDQIEQLNRAGALHLTDFEPPLYNVWKQQTKSEGLEHFGNSDAMGGRGKKATCNTQSFPRASRVRLLGFIAADSGLRR